jgi:2-polyprenyl-3-methyl-5-hydroxy-6-metoxy-1,4-benzoquinol methylase
MHSGKTQSSHRWGKTIINLQERSFPALKASRVLDALPANNLQAKILDFGCGEGKMLKTLARERPLLELFGTDLQLPETHAGFTFLSLSELPENTFDVIICIDVLEHVENINETLQLINRCLKPGGYFIGFVPAEGNRISFYKFYRWLITTDLYLQTKDHRQAYSRKNIRDMLSQQFELATLSYSYHLLGSFFDATFFALQYFKFFNSVKKSWWHSNIFYHPDAKPNSTNFFIKWANWLGHVESSFFKKINCFASGVHFTARKSF